MEEDDPTRRALPRWVELEYKVSINGLHHSPFRALFRTWGLTMSTNDHRRSALWARNPHLSAFPSPGPPPPLPTTPTSPSNTPHAAMHPRTGLAHAHARRTRCVHRLYAPLARSERLPLRRLRRT